VKNHAPKQRKYQMIYDARADSTAHQHDLDFHARRAYNPTISCLFAHTILGIAAALDRGSTHSDPGMVRAGASDPIFQLTLPPGKTVVAGEPGRAARVMRIK
jgi:hypothetical protein